jgi:hypothetical protein
LLEPLSPRPGDANDLMKSKIELQYNEIEASPSSFDLDRIINKYGDHPALLQLILSSKVEEDRRRAEEARLKQKELDYLISSEGKKIFIARCIVTLISKI